MRGKVAITGVSSLATETAERVLDSASCEVVLVHSEGSTGEAAAADLSAAAAATGRAARVSGADGWDAAAGCDVAVLCDGDAATAARGVAQRCPDAVVVVAQDPVEEACATVLSATAFPRGRVVGVGGCVEALRLRAGVARELAVSAADVSALVLGGRGERAVPVLGSLRAGGGAVTDKLPAERIASLVAALGAGPGPASRTVAAATAAVVGAICSDARALIPCVMLCQGEAGVDGAVAGVPVVLGAEGVEQVLDVVLSDDERAALAAAAVPYS